MVDVQKIIKIQQTKNLNNLTEQMSVYSIQFFNDIFLKQFAYSVIWVQ